MVVPRKKKKKDEKTDQDVFRSRVRLSYIVYTEAQMLIIVMSRGQKS